MKAKQVSYKLRTWKEITMAVNVHSQMTATEMRI